MSFPREESAGHVVNADGARSDMRDGTRPMEELGGVRGKGGRFHKGATKVPKKKGGPARAQGKGETLAEEASEQSEDTGTDTVADERGEKRRKWRDGMMDKSWTAD